jgi:hypothetical protein
MIKWLTKFFIMLMLSPILFFAIPILGLEPESNTGDLAILGAVALAIFIPVNLAVNRFLGNE